MRVITVSRKHCDAGSLTSNVVAHGTGAINVTDTALGTRWPANSFLLHHPGCMSTGEKTVPGYIINRWVDGAKPFGGGAGHEYDTEVLPDQTVQLWECEPGCPVKPLTSLDYRCFKHFQPKEAGLFEEMQEYLFTLIAPPEDAFIIAVTDLNKVPWDICGDGVVHGLIMQGDPTDFLQEIDRVLKPGAHVLILSPEEDPMGIDGACAIEEFGYEIRDSIACFEHEDEHHYFSKPSSKERHNGVESWFDPETKRDVHNNHATVKPVGVMMSLLADVPKDQGLVVDPFLGSGTTALACLRTRHEFLGIEQSERYTSIADQRIRYWSSEINSWEGLELTSDVVVEEESSEPMTLDEFFGFVPKKGE